MKQRITAYLDKEYKYWSYPSNISTLTASTAMNTVLCLVLYLGVMNSINGIKVCRCGWQSFHGSCYYFSDQKITYAKANVYCKQHGGYLVKINNKMEGEWIRKMAQDIEEHTKVRRCFYLGLTDTQHEGTWKWSIDGTPVKYTNWNPREPNNHGGNEDCVLLLDKSYGGKWNDRGCTASFNFICEGAAVGRKPCKCIY